jgi:hypothetical protein
MRRFSTGGTSGRGGFSQVRITAERYPQT